MIRDDRWMLALVCVCYLTIVYITSRGLIAAPRYRLLEARIRDCRARASVLAGPAAGDSERSASLAALSSRLDDLELGRAVVWRLAQSSWVVAIPLSKLAAAWRVLHSAERRLLRLETPAERASSLQFTRLVLLDSQRAGDTDLAAQLAAHPPDSPQAEALLLAVNELLHQREDSAAELEYEQQRIALWLAMTGLGALLLVGLVLGHTTTMLFGALGGFLSPVIGVLRSQRHSSWGVLVLAPVGGALAATGGLLLVRMLADPRLSVLGTVFLDSSWNSPDQPVAMATALLFGFSGTLFSRLALTATGQIAAPPDPPPHQ
ncbi:hypothetical protein [Streptomyces sp. RKAG337]|uniref:hypothetical protein n=1 Tax=Streptomyces sp. RKAG337 TaxID=2893404 RepID=UPI00203353C4|nr:hypothetical protein [Streptomyces sp. RKAG337]MCM2424910.1 hypothetical protein [Streptomyces sp. RKAG337]